MDSDLSALAFIFALRILHLTSVTGHLSQVVSAGSQIDTMHPIVITDQFSNTGRQSLFGFSAVLVPHFDVSHGWVIVGAPRSNTSDRDYKQRQINEPGVIWRCSLAREPGSNNTCRILFIDPLNSQIGKADCRPNACPSEKHDGSGLGFTLAINAERLVACAPRWQRQFGPPDSSTFKMNGICHWIPLQLALSEPFSIAPMITSGFRSQRLFPLLDRNMQLRENYPIWSWGQTGFAVHLTPSPGNDLYLGAPGVNGWNGTVIKYQDQDQDQTQGADDAGTGADEAQSHGLRTRPNANGKREFALFSLLQTDFLQFYIHLEYLGYAITTGVYFQAGQRLVATSSPRGGRLRGLVLVFEFPVQETPYWYPTQVLQGKLAGFGSYFGYTLESVDVNGDGLDELLVGAPWAQDTGCVYVYTAAAAGKLTQRFGRPLAICGGDSSDSDVGLATRFGSSIAKLGDVNGDGVHDFAVGAPGDGGAVYVYHGSQSHAGIESLIKPALKLTPGMLGLPAMAAVTSGFGTAIFGGVDVDGNGTPDFVVGAPLSQQIILVRTRPRVEFEGHVDAYIEHGHGHASDSESDSFIKVLPIHASQFIVRSCARVRARTLKSDFKYEIQVTLNVDGELGRFTILAPLQEGHTHGHEPNAFQFERPADEGTGTVRYHINVIAQPTPKTGNSSTIDSNTDADACTEWIVHRVDHLATEDQNPRPIRILQELYYKSQGQGPPSPESYTITRNARAVPELVANLVHQHFCKFCPPSTRTLTELHIPLAVDNCDADGVPACSPRLLLAVHFLEVAESTSTSKFVLGTSKELTALVEVHNEAGGETAYFPRARLELIWSGHAAAAGDIAMPIAEDCDPEPQQEDQSRISLRCDLGDRLQPNKTRSVRLVFSMAEYFTRSRNETLTLSAEVTSIPEPGTHTETDTSANELLEATTSISLDLVSDAQLQLLGSIEKATMQRVKETDADDASETLTKITHTYTVSVEGSSPIRALRMSFWFPVRAASAYNKNGTQAQGGSDLILVGAPKGNAYTQACRMVTPNATFYTPAQTHGRGADASEPGRWPKSRQIPPYFSAAADRDSVGQVSLEEDASDWVLDADADAREQKSLQTKNWTTQAPKRTFSTLANDSRSFLQRAHVTYALRCTHTNQNCVRVDCALAHVAPGRRILIRFPIYVRSGVRERALYENKTADVSSRKWSLRLRASGLYPPTSSRSLNPDQEPLSQPGRVLIQSMARAHIFDEDEDAEAGDENVDVRFASFVTLLALHSGDGSASAAGTKLARLPIGWVYFISAIVSLGLLLALVYCLVKCGFFQRRRAQTSRSPQWRAVRYSDMDTTTTGKETVG